MVSKPDLLAGLQTTETPNSSNIIAGEKLIQVSCHSPGKWCAASLAQQ